MIANVSAHRRANAFAQALEDRKLQDAAAARPGPAADTAADSPAPPGGEQGKLLALADGLAQLPAPELDPEVKTVQRARLIAAMEAQFAGGAAVPEQRGSKSGGRGAHRASTLGRLKPRSRWSKGLAAGGLTVGVAAGAFGGVAAASSNALPGDTLYGLKRGMEDLKLGLADSDSERGEILLDQASTRLSEARRLMERGRSGPLDHESLSEIRRTLSGMRHDVSEGHRLLRGAFERDGSLAPMRLLSSFTASHQEGWSQLRDRLPLPLNDVKEQVSSAFKAIDDDVQPLQSLLHGTGRQDAHGKPETPARHGAPGSAGHSAPAPRTSQSTDGRQPGGQSAQPSSGAHEDHDGLLGPGGLLHPPNSGESSGTSGSAHGKEEKSRQPDITIPPILPNVLPGLGLQGEDAK
ncbi:DUF5667 domain-containing protein [Streptomyces orinoci]|uniref:DUF5667 domain-containing protein n=1 Tax=Streptomyces orinoci TaxID=67339 RepID=A0ABV3K508_STRON|nr:DUF5667 domain-containing protein [Streptomyces orinoci]